MPKSRAEYNAYMKKYMRDRYYRRRTLAIEQLGGKCAVLDCGSTAGLEIDHIEPSKKKFSVGVRLAGIAESKLQRELVKCQLLCRAHHGEKTVHELGREFARGTHGTLSAARYCKPRCDACRKACNAYTKEYKRKKRLEAGMKPRKQRKT